MARITLLFLLWLLMAAMVVIAAPDVLAYTYPGQESVAADDQAAELVRNVAVPFAAARIGTAACPAGITVYRATDLGLTANGIPAAARGLDCQIWVHARWLSSIRQEQRDGLRFGNWLGARTNLVVECKMILHETYHALGWTPAPAEAAAGDPYHATSGFMGQHSTHMDAPGDCWAWAGRIVRHHRAKARARAGRIRVDGPSRRPRSRVSG